METEQQHLISFHHCHGSILCFQLPDQCPLCKTSLTTTRLASPPVRYPSVFTTASTSPCSIVIKPTIGTFLNDYKDGVNLHAGITSTKGIVYAFDEEGVQLAKGKSTWKQCVAVDLLDQFDDDIMSIWDKELKAVAADMNWSKDRYHETKHNCFDFVVAFLNHIQYNKIKWDKPGNITRDELCRNYIVPLTARASKYMTVYRCVQQNGFLVQE